MILAAKNITVTPKSLETDVKSAIAKVTSGEADATVVYVTDVTAAGSKVAGVTVARRRPARHHLPDRGRQGDQEPGRGPGVRRLGGVGRCAEGVGGCRFPPARRRTGPKLRSAWSRPSWPPGLWRWSSCRSSGCSSAPRGRRWSPTCAPTTRSRRCACRWRPRSAPSALSVLLGVPLAWILARSRFPGRALVRALVTLPMVLPPVVGGIALLYAFGKRGFAGRILYDLTGWRLVFNTSGAIVAEAFVSMPFLVVTAEAAFRSMDRGAEEAAATFGASPRLPVPPRHPARRRPRAGRGCGAHLGPGAGRVRGDDHLRRQLPRHHPDHAAAGLPRHRVRPRRHRPGPVAGPPRRVAGRAGRAAGPLARQPVTPERLDRAQPWGARPRHRP